jgi:hypothetical protein
MKALYRPIGFLVSVLGGLAAGAHRSVGGR